MIIRKATKEDYKQVERLYVDPQKQWLYLSADETEMTEADLKKVLYDLCLPEDFLQKVESECSTYTYEQYCKELAYSDMHYCVFEEDLGEDHDHAKMIIGYIQFRVRKRYHIDPITNKPLWNEKPDTVALINEWGVESLDWVLSMGMLLKCKYPKIELITLPANPKCREIYELISKINVAHE